MGEDRLERLARRRSSRTIRNFRNQLRGHVAARPHGRPADSFNWWARTPIIPIPCFTRTTGTIRACRRLELVPAMVREGQDRSARRLRHQLSGRRVVQHQLESRQRKQSGAVLRTELHDSGARRAICQFCFAEPADSAAGADRCQATGGWNRSMCASSRSPASTTTASIRTFRISTLEIQRELAKNLTLEARYIGSKGTKLYGGISINDVNILLRPADRLLDAFNITRAGGDAPLVRHDAEGSHEQRNQRQSGPGVVNGRLSRVRRRCGKTRFSEPSWPTATSASSQAR